MLILRYLWYSFIDIASNVWEVLRGWYTHYDNRLRDYLAEHETSPSKLMEAELGRTYMIVTEDKENDDGKLDTTRDTG